MEMLNTPRRKLLVVAVAIVALAAGAALLAVSSSATAHRGHPQDNGRKP